MTDLNNVTPIDVTPEQFAAIAQGSCPACGSPVTLSVNEIACVSCGFRLPDTETRPAEDYFIRNRETGKMELHFAKSTYDALSDAQRSAIRSNYVWGRKSGCWISRAKEPHLHFARKVAQDIGLIDAGDIGERLSFAEQMQRKAEKAERRAERFESISAAAEKNGEALTKPLHEACQDIAFATQPIHNTSAGRAFQRKRERMIAAFDRGIEEFRKSEYYAERAEIARQTAAQKNLTDKAFIQRRIEECEASLRAIKRNIEHYEKQTPAAEAGTLKSYDGTIITPDDLNRRIAGQEERMEAELDKLAYYTAALDALGGIQYSRENIKPGYVVQVDRYGRSQWQVISCGAKKFKAMEPTGCGLLLVFSYAQIVKVISTESKTGAVQPFKVGEVFTTRRGSRHEIVRATDKTVTMRREDGTTYRVMPKYRPVPASGKCQWVLIVGSDMDAVWIYRD